MTWVWVLYCLNDKCTKDLSGKSSDGSKKDEVVYTILLTTPEYRNVLPTECILIEVAGVQWMERATRERGFSIQTLTKTGQRYSLGDLSTCCFHDDRHEWT